MKSKGVQSVQARVVNLTELQPAITVDAVADALVASFRKAYNSDVPVEDAIRDGKTGRALLEELYCKYSSWNWRYGEAPKFDIDIETRFPWGGIEIGFKLENGLVREALAYSDAMDEEFISGLPDVLKGCAFSSQQLAQRVRDIPGKTDCSITDEAACKASDEAICSVIKDTADDTADTAANRARAAMALDIAGWLEGKGF